MKKTPPNTSPGFRELRPAVERVEEPLPKSRPETAKHATRKLPLTSEACDWCRSKKSKCSGPPRCEACISRGLVCTFNYHESKRQVFTREERNTLLSRIRELEATIGKIRTGSDDEVAQEIHRLRHEPDAAAEIGGGMDVVELGDRPFYTPAESQGEMWTSIHDSFNEGVSPSAASDESMSGLQLEVYHKGNLPTEAAVHAAIAALGDTTADMFFIITAAESQKLLVQLYSKAKAEITKADICLVCAFCALGSHFVSSPIAEHSKKSLFKTAWMLIDDCFEIDVLQTLRALLCLALFSLLEKKSSARLMLAFGLQIARGLESSSNRHTLSLEESESFRKLYRSLVLFDSYLATKIVYTISSEEADFARISTVGEGASTEDSFAYSFISLARIISTIPNNLYDNDEYRFSLISNLMLRLSAWQYALPSEMQLAVLTATEEGDIPTSRRTAILYLHEAYLSVVVFLHRGLIPTLLEHKFAGQKWPIDAGAETADDFYSRTMVTAQQCVRINTLLAHTASAVFRQCWLLLCEIFVCSCVLLVDAAANISTGSNDASLQSASDAMDTMEYMRHVDEVASGALMTLRPMYDELKRLQEARTEGVQRDVVDPAAGAVLKQAVHVLQSINAYRSRQSLANKLSSIRDLDDW